MWVLFMPRCEQNLPPLLEYPESKLGCETTASSVLYWSLARGTVPITMSTGTLRLQDGPASITFNWAEKTEKISRPSEHLAGQKRQRKSTGYQNVNKYLKSAKRAC